MLVIGNGINLFDIVAETKSEEYWKERVFDLINQRIQRIGELKFLYKSNFQANDGIYTATQAKLYDDGWVYPNGTFISKQFFPDAYAFLKNIDYPGKNDNGSGITLPKIDQFIQISNTSGITFNDQSFGFRSHFHKMNDSASDLSGKKFLVHNGAWIWSTRAAGAGTEDIERTYTSYKTCTVCGGSGIVKKPNKNGVYVNTICEECKNKNKYNGVTKIPDTVYTIPKTASAHSGKGLSGRAIETDIPIRMNGGYISDSAKLDNQTTGPMELDTEETYITKSDIQPKHIIVPIMMYIGIPQI